MLLKYTDGLVDYVRTRDAAQDEPHRPPPKRRSAERPGSALRNQQKITVQAAAYTRSKSRSTRDFVHLSAVFPDVLALLTVLVERGAGTMTGPIRPEQLAASRALDLIANLEGTELW